MATKISNFSVGSTGNKTVTGILFMPSSLEFVIAQKTSVNETFAHYSSGSSNGTSQMAHSIFQDASGGKTESYFNRCLNHINRVSGTLTDVVVATFVSFDNNGGGDYGFTLNFTVADPNYKIYFIARD